MKMNPKFDPTTHVSDTLVLVIDRNNKRFGELGRLTAHDWGEYGYYYAKFADGSEETFRDGLCR